MSRRTVTKLVASSSRFNPIISRQKTIQSNYCLSLSSSFHINNHNQNHSHNNTYSTYTSTNAPNALRNFSSAAAASNNNSSGNSNHSSYQSPYSDYFNRLKTNAPSPLTGPSSSPSSSQDINILKCGIPESVLKFKTTSYGRLMLPPYVQPGEYKVTLKVYGRELPLDTDLEKQIFCQIVGRRYNVDRDELKLTSDQFASRIENKRHLCSMLDRIVLGAKRLAEEIEDGKNHTTT